MSGLFVFFRARSRQIIYNIGKTWRNKHCQMSINVKKMLWRNKHCQMSINVKKMLFQTEDFEQFIEYHRMCSSGKLVCIPAQSVQ